MDDSTRKPSSDKAEPNPILQAALEYLALDFSVIPVHGVVNGQCTCGQKNCPSVGKHPALKTWKKYQKTRATAEEIRRWFTTHPERNVGVITGAISGIVVLDLDGQEGIDNFAALGIEIPKTPTVKTGGGGRHYYLKYPPGGLPNSASKIGPKIDVRGDGGFVVAPPSLHASGNTYAGADHD